MVEQFGTRDGIDGRFGVELAARRDRERFYPIALVSIEGVLELDPPDARRLASEVVDDTGRDGLELDTKNLESPWPDVHPLGEYVINT